MAFLGIVWICCNPKQKCVDFVGAYTMRWLGPRDATDAFFFPGDYGNEIEFGRETTAVTTNPAFKPEEAWNIDTKLDDGLPATGVIFSREAQTACGGSTDPALAEYQLTSTATACALIFLRII